MAAFRETWINRAAFVQGLGLNPSQVAQDDFSAEGCWVIDDAKLVDGYPARKWHEFPVDRQEEALAACKRDFEESIK